MTHVLAISSWVAAGHVGLCAIVPALQALGHRVTQLPTVQLSNHAGWPNVSGAPVPTGQLDGMLDALMANGFLSDVDALLTGYMPSPAHVELALRVADRVAPSRIVVDPVLGDLPKGLYVPREVAEALRDRLLPLATHATPNRFELGWLTGLPVETIAEIRHAAAALGPGTVHVTSAAPSRDEIGVLTLGARGAEMSCARKRLGVPNGVGDVLAGLLAAGLPMPDALGHLDALIAESLNHPHLRIAETAAEWTKAPPLPVTEI